MDLAGIVVEWTCNRRLVDHSAQLAVAMALDIVEDESDRSGVRDDTELLRPIQRGDGDVSDAPARTFWVARLPILPDRTLLRLA